MDFCFDDCYEAVRRRDRTYDGRFFTGVTSTGIFCRPVCPAITPKPENCRFFPSAAAALEAGFRPCLRCRPESAPDSPAWNGVRTTVSRALRLIAQGALDEGGVESLAARLGVGSRYLRKLFSENVGASPIQVARAGRLLKAKRLITETELSMSEIAMAAGFASIRQFNHSFSGTYGRHPGTFRPSERREQMKQLELSLHHSPIGDINVVHDSETLVYMDFADNPERMEGILTRRYGEFEIRRTGSSPPVHAALEKYFAHGGDPFGDLVLDPGGTPFQSAVWQALRTIPVGTTLDYSSLARKVGKPKAFRAAGTSNGRNPISIVIPCHRVIGQDGTLRGYAGGTDRKRWLIEHEKRCTGMAS